MGESDHRRLQAALGQRKHAESALWALIGLPRMEPVEYSLSVLADVYYVAHNGVTRPQVGVRFDEAGRKAKVLDPMLDRYTHIALRPHFESRPPAHHPGAQRVLRDMLRDYDRMGSRYLSSLDEIVGEATT